MKTTVLIILFFAGAILAELNLMIINDQYQFIAVGAVVIVDLIFGVLKALKLKNFETRKSFKSLFMLGAFWLLLATVLTIEKGFAYVDWLSEAILLPILIFQLISILKNMELLGLISNELFRKILSSIDSHKEKNASRIPYDDHQLENIANE
ncbi:conserved membrane hypothetical protein [Tenacibaculum sp. 190524A02b]|uniref:Holin n=1 Tax=Tenacibaculum vairaonense TaxID=3137860 RepID=A0ABP1FAR9_9FLAO